MLLTLKSHDATSVSFPIIPIKLGKVSIKVIVAAELSGDDVLSVVGTIASDIVQRNILVVVSLWKSSCYFVTSVPQLDEDC